MPGGVTDALYNPRVGEFYTAAWLLLDIPLAAGLEYLSGGLDSRSKYLIIQYLVDTGNY